MFLVTGGRDDRDNFLDSTETFDPLVGSWTAGAKLPRLMFGIRAEGNLLFGKYYFNF